MHQPRLPAKPHLLAGYKTDCLHRVGEEAGRWVNSEQPPAFHQQGKRMKLLFSPYNTFVFYFFQSGTYFHYYRHPFVKK